MVVKEVKGYALSKEFLNDKIFARYPVREFFIKRQAKHRYKKHLKQRLIRYREEHIQWINKKSEYKAIKLE